MSRVWFRVDLYMGKQKLSASQKQQVSQFQGITGASKEQAAECLHAGQWNVEVAINFFFNRGLTPGTPKDNSAIITLYERYKDRQQAAILADGVWMSTLYFSPESKQCTEQSE